MAVRTIHSPGTEILRAKALSTPSRVDILARLQRATSPLTAADLATAMAMHHTAVREHLALMLDAGLVRGAPLPIIGRGRPRTGYSAVELLDEAARYRALAAMLAHGVQAGLSARESGRVAGAQVSPQPGGAVVTLRNEAERLGFQPQARVKGTVHSIVLKHCPFAALAVERPETVCDLHLGLAEGICELHDGAVVEGLKLADPRKGGCRITVRTVPAARSTT
ncbi:MAG: helix-turn-helix domain-containing protein [Actinomycetota bacterium]